MRRGLFLACFALAWCIAAPGHAQDMDPKLNPDLIPGHPPQSLIGLWAKAGKCGIRSGRLLVTAHFLTFSDKKPIPYTYIPDVPHRFFGVIYYDGEESDLVFDRETRIISYFRDDADPAHVYFPCFGPNPGWPPRVFPVDPNEKTAE